MRSLLILLALVVLSPASSLAKADASKSGSGSRGKTLAICTSAIHRNLVQIRGDGNQVSISVTKDGRVVGNLRGERSVKGTVQAANLEVQYAAMNGFVNLSCKSEPAGLIQVNGVTDYLACNSGPDARAIEICNNRWSNAR